MQSSTKTTDYLWTENGELASETVNGALSKAYAWGPDGTLQSVELLGDDLRVDYAYDRDGTLIGRQATRTDTGETLENRRFLTDEGLNVTGYSQTLAEIDAAAGAVAVVNAYRPEGIGGQTKLEGGQANKQWLLGDALGSVRALAQDGDSAQAYDYAAFGQSLRGDRSKTRYAFTGQVADGETGAQYHRARWLDTGLGQWASIDSFFDFSANLGQAIGYAGQKVLNSSDPTGFFTSSETILVASFIAGLAGFVVNSAIAIITGYRQGGFTGAAGSFVVNIFSSLAIAAIVFTIGIVFIAAPLIALGVAATTAFSIVSSLAFFLGIFGGIWGLISSIRNSRDAFKKGDKLLGALEAASAALAIFELSIVFGMSKRGFTEWRNYNQAENEEPILKGIRTILSRCGEVVGRFWRER